MSEYFKKTASQRTGRAPPMKTRMDRNDMLIGFDVLSKKISSLGLDPVTIVVAGSACFVLLQIGSLKAAKDINFFSDADSIRSMTTARASAMPDLPDYPPAWINADLVAHVANHRGCEDLFNTSLKSNAILFSSSFLRVYAADWRYQFVGKVKMAYDEVQYSLSIDVNHKLSASVHMFGAIMILREMIDMMAGSRRPLHLSQVRSWYYYGSFITNEQAMFINAFYRRTFVGITADPILLS